MRFVIALLTLWLTVLPAALRADDAPVVIELFTSQGCSSCPPADRLLQDIGSREDVIALALHVDYWDYLGWKDSFAQSAFSKRQKAYAHTGRRRTVFTPELVVQGQDSFVGHKGDRIQASIAAHRTQPRLATLTVERSADGFALKISPVGTSAPAADLLLVRFLPNDKVMIERGENAGKTVLYTNIVGKITQIGSWNGASDATIVIEKIDGPHAVIVQQTNHGPILTAARLN